MGKSYPNGDIARKLNGRAWARWCIERHLDGDVRVSNLSGSVIRIGHERMRISEGMQSNTEIRSKRFVSAHKAFGDILGAKNAVVGNGITTREIRSSRKLLRRISDDLMVNPEQYAVTMEQ